MHFTPLPSLFSELFDRHVPKLQSPDSQSELKVHAMPLPSFFSEVFDRHVPKLQSPDAQSELNVQATPLVRPLFGVGVSVFAAGGVVARPPAALALALAIALGAFGFLIGADVVAAVTVTLFAGAGFRSVASSGSSDLALDVAVVRLQGPRATSERESHSAAFTGDLQATDLMLL